MSQTMNQTITQNSLLSSASLGSSSQSSNVSETFSATPMQTVVGVVPVGNSSYDIQGNVVDSTNDLPIDINALMNVTVSEASLVMPKTGLVPIVD